MKPDPAPQLAADPALTERVRAAAELLELVAANRSVLAEVSGDDRKRLLNAAGQVYNPDARARRQLVKASVRLRKAARVQRDEGALGETGIRQLRKQSVFNTPNVFPPPGFEQVDVEGDPDFREAVQPQNCYVCKQDYSAIHHFYDQLCPACAEFNFAEAHRAGRPARTRGAAHGRPREDRLSGRPQAAARRCRADRHDALSARFGQRAMRAKPTSTSGATGSRSLASTCATRPVSRSSAGELLGDARPTRLHRQQRLPDRAPATWFLSCT